MVREVFHPGVADISLDTVPGALSDPVRRDMLRRIAEEGPLYCGDLAYSVVKSMLSYHLGTLRLSGLMHTEALGRRRRVTCRDRATEQRFLGLLKAVGLSLGKDYWEGQEVARPGAVR